MNQPVNRTLLKFSITGFVIGLLVGLSAIAAEKPKAPKYAADVTPLSSDRKYFEKHDAPDFWRLMPYYVSQINGAACSGAVFATVINAARSKMPLAADDKLATQRSLAEQLKDRHWGKTILEASKYSQEELMARFRAGLLKRSPIFMSEYDAVLGPLFEKNGMKLTDTKWLHVKDTGAETRKAVRDLLIQNEKTDQDFVILDMIQGDLTGDAEAMNSAHVAIVGAFDAERDRVLVLDPDREWYEPYWTTLDRVLASTVKLEKHSQQHHGLYHLKYEMKK